MRRHLANQYGSSFLEDVFPRIYVRILKRPYIGPRGLLMPFYRPIPFGQPIPGEGVAAYPVGYEDLHCFIPKDSIKLFKVLLMAGIRAVNDPCPLIDPILIRIEKVDGVSLTTQVHLVQEVGRNSIFRGES